MNRRHLPWLFVSIIASIAILLLPSPMTPVVLAAAQPSGWIELIDERTPVGKKYINLAEPGRYTIHTSLPTIHYESTLGSDVYDLEVDFTPRRVNNAQLDGWTVTQNGWHYALGQPGDKSTDGWVGFGGRQGDHWIKFRLARVGYLHWPTRTWDDLGGAPTYDRAQLSSVTSSSEYGHGNMVNVQTTATWSNIWTTPGGGSLNISWRANADGLKEDIIINQAAREWLAANRPPSTPLAETWFGFALQVDWSDMPKIVRAGLELNPNDDFADDGKGIELRDALDRFLAFLPIGDVRVPSSDILTPDDVQPLRKRFWLDGDGNNYVLVGVRADILNGMQAGDLVFDPTVDEQVGASLDDGWSRSTGTFMDTAPQVYVGDSAGTIDTWARFTTVNVPAASTIDVAYITITPDVSSSNLAKTRIYFDDNDSAIAPTTQAEHAALTRTSAFTTWDDEVLVVDVPENSPSIVNVIQEVISRPGWSANNALQLLWDDDGSGSAIYYRLYSYDGDPAEVIKLHIEYTPGWINSPPTITNKITSDSGQISTAYSRQFDATDADSNQTLIWEINATDAAFLSIDSLNRTAYINGTLPSSEGTYYVNVTVGDQASPNATDFVNYTLTIIILVEELTDIQWIEIIMIGLMFFFLTAIGLAVSKAWFLLFIGGLIGISYGIWLIGLTGFQLFGLTFLAPGLLVMVYGGIIVWERYT